jgi:hypothetical protein
LAVAAIFGQALAARSAAEYLRVAANPKGGRASKG